MYVRRLGAYSGVTVYALYPGRSTLEGLRGLGWRSWLEGLAKWFVRAIQSSSFLYKIVTSSAPFPLLRIRSGEEERKETLLLPVRILDDLVMCKARAWYGIRERREGIIRRVPHIELRTSDESKKVEKSVFLDVLMKELRESIILGEREPRLRTKVGNIVLKGKPDLYLVVNLNGYIRGLIIDLQETSFDSLTKTWHIIPRLYTYVLASHMKYGVTPIAFSIPLSMAEEFAILCLSKTNGVSEAHTTSLHLSTIITLYSELNYLSILAKPPRPSTKSRIFCNECRYRAECEYRLI